MKWRMEDLQRKEVIDMAGGFRCGYVDDIEFDPNTGMVHSLVIAGRPRLFGLLGRDPDLIIPLSAIRSFGEDVLLMDGGQKPMITPL